MTTEPEHDTPTEELRYRTTPAAAAEIRDLVAEALGRMERDEKCRSAGGGRNPTIPAGAFQAARNAR